MDDENQQNQQEQNTSPDTTNAASPADSSAHISANGANNSSGSNDSHGAHGTGPGDTDEDQVSELERQARETVRAFRETAGDLGARVRQVLERASSLWDEAHPGVPGESNVSAEDALRGRALARRWVERDFLVDPDLPEAMTVQRVLSADIWRVELRERGETRSIVDAREPYTGQRPPEPGPILPVWDYDFPVTPDIEAGERHERISGAGVIAACRKCNGSGHRSCVACEGRGFVQCPICHGRARIPCKRCRGRGRIADPKAERRARSSMGYFHVQAERLRQDASERLVDFAERLRQDYGIPLPPTGRIAPIAPASGETIPCPDCVNGTVPCACGNGKLICETCGGTSAMPCAACGGTGKVVQHRELVRRFDTRISQRTLPLDDPEMTQWLTEGMVRKGSGEEVWSGPFDAIQPVNVAPPPSVPPAVWATILDAARDARGRLVAGEDENAADDATGQRHVISRRISLMRVPVTRVEYTFADQRFAFMAVGRSGAERFWAQAFPPRWSRVNRFLKALSRDLQRDTQAEHSRPHSTLTHIDDFRARKAANGSGDASADDQADKSESASSVRIEEAQANDEKPEDGK